jgi:hypothetical protein
MLAVVEEGDQRPAGERGGAPIREVERWKIAPRTRLRMAPGDRLQVEIGLRAPLFGQRLRNAD